MRIVLTGATGLLGRNLLFEILKQYKDRLDELEIIILGRTHQGRSLQSRIKDIVSLDGLEYIDLIESARPQFFSKLDTVINPIPFDLTRENLNITPEDQKKLKAGEIDHFFHVAALTDFRSGSEIISKLQEVNVNGTKRVLDLIKALDVRQLCYVGSAYSCGSKAGLVEPDYINPEQTFRNPYERSKLDAEIAVREFARRKAIPSMVFRPSTICGRLIEKPIGSINKFDVFYAWAAFFLRLKVQHLKSLENLYTTPFELSMPVRIALNPNSGLNIVPCDYAAKVLYQASINNWEGNSFHLVNESETPHKTYIATIFEQLNIRNYLFVSEEPHNQNELEKFHYKTVGKLFAPYTLASSIKFDTANLQAGLSKSDLTCPSVNKENMIKLIEYAKTKYFNIDTDKLMHEGQKALA